MKTLYVSICLALSYHSLAFPLPRGVFQYPETAFKFDEELKERQNKSSQQSMLLLQKIKFLIIKGNLDFAKVLLKEASLSDDFSKKIQLRYLSIINFIEGNYKQVNKILSQPIMQNIEVGPKTCIMQTLSFLFRKKIDQVEKTWRNCADSAGAYSSNNLIWMRIMVGLHTNKTPNYIENIFKETKIDTVKAEQLRIFLKLALYLNQQEKIIPRFNLFSENVLMDDVLRELIGFNYFRAGNLTKAFSLIEPLSTANSEVFKGNIYLFQKKYPQAFAQYKLALQRKNNSQNAIRQLIPLSWQLKEYQEGLDYLQKNPISNENSVEFYTLMAAFLVMDKKFYSAEKILNKVIDITNKGQPLEVNQLYSYTSLKNQNYSAALLYSASSCDANDGLNCWLYMTGSEWSGLLEKIHTDKSQHEGAEDLLALNIKSVRNEKLIELNPVDQRKIEEMDNNLIDLMPKD